MKTKPNSTSSLSNTSKVNPNTEKNSVDVAIKSETTEQKNIDNSSSQEKSPQKKESNKQETGKGKYPLVHVESEHSLFDRDPKGELESHEMHPGHLVSVENVGSVPDHYRKLSDGEARNLDMIKITQEDYLKTKDRNKERHETKKYKHLKSEEKLTLLQLSMLKSNRSCTRNEKRDSFEEDPIIAAYYEEEEKFCMQKLAEYEAEKNEPSKISVEITFNHPWKRKKSRNSEDPIPVGQIGSTESHPSVQEERKKSNFSLDSNSKSSKLTYKSLEAEGYSVFDSDDTVFNNILEEERGIKTEFLIRLKRGTNIERHEKENQRPLCSEAYLKCYFYSKPKMFQKPKKESSTPTLIGISGEAYWDHVFILRGFTIDELENVYVLINVKGKCREQGKEQEQGHNKGIQFDKVFRAVKGKNLSLGVGILAGKEAKIIPSPDFRYREPMEEEYQGWMNALLNPGIPQKFQMTVENEDDDSSDESDTGNPRKWHSVLRHK